MQLYRGLGVSDGVAIGKVLRINSAFVNYPRRQFHEEADGVREVERILAAQKATESQLDELMLNSPEDLPEEFKDLFHGYKLLMQDRQFIPTVVTTIQQNLINAEWALIRVIAGLEKKFAQVPDAYIRARFDDIRQIGEKLMANLLQKRQLDLTQLKEPVVLVCNDISPADAFHLNTRNILGIITQMGGQTSHASILARAMNIPAVVGVFEITNRLLDDDRVILDGSSGEVIADPDEEIIKEKLSKKERFAFFQKELEKLIGVDCKLADGTYVDLAANLDFAEEIPHIHKLKIPSIGLMRTEFFFMLDKSFPTEEEQYQLFRKVADESGCNPITIRTWDIGSDKSTDLLPELKSEANPALGIRAVRICLKYEDLFRQQIRAILRASQHSQIKLMIPMVTRVDEIVQTQNIIQDELLQLGLSRDNLKVGVMVETPASIFILDEILDLCDFISIGSNDLIQYTLAVDRLNEHVASLYSPFHPAVLKMLEMIILKANKRGKPVAICGELAANPVMQFFLIGVGEITFSMSPNKILTTKQVLSNVDRPTCQKIAFQFVNKHSTEEADHYAKELLQKLVHNPWD